MNAIILYASKYGSTKTLAERMGKEMGCDVCDIKSYKGAIDAYDMVVFGANVYAGMLAKECKAFIKENQNVLVDKKTAMFLCGLQKDTQEKVIRENLGEDFYKQLISADTLGGTLDFQKMNFMERQIIKAINKKTPMFELSKKNELVILLDEDRIKSFVGELKR